ncbi:hypothetical protein CDCA_CDCA08G2368 [Cyanidium caldarium]|uniref:Uncharacterized protein n=1 Tax=Cyanidium caldarium TaxID=2771 RepID=A0AAV9IX09_CYACA|nr:hypothetical protein CDCA_CDCA08G2368 [Cyanidium caldarium]
MALSFVSAFWNPFALLKAPVGSHFGQHCSRAQHFYVHRLGTARLPLRAQGEWPPQDMKARYRRPEPGEVRRASRPPPPPPEEEKEEEEEDEEEEDEPPAHLNEGDKYIWQLNQISRKRRQEVMQSVAAASRQRQRRAARAPADAEEPPPRRAPAAAETNTGARLDEATAMLQKMREEFAALQFQHETLKNAMASGATAAADSHWPETPPPPPPSPSREERLQRVTAQDDPESFASALKEYLSEMATAGRGSSPQAAVTDRPARDVRPGARNGAARDAPLTLAQELDQALEIYQFEMERVKREHVERVQRLLQKHQLQ